VVPLTRQRLAAHGGRRRGTGGACCARARGHGSRQPRWWRGDGWSRCPRRPRDPPAQTSRPPHDRPWRDASSGRTPEVAANGRRPRGRWWAAPSPPPPQRLGAATASARPAKWPGGGRSGTGGSRPASPPPRGGGTTCHERADHRRAVGAVGPHWPRRSHGGELPVAGGGGAPPPPILARHPPSASADQWRCRWAADRVTAAAGATATKGHRTRQRVGRTRRPPAVGRRLAAVTGRPPLGLRRPWPPRQAAARRADAVRAGGSGSAAHPRAAGPRRRRQR